MPHIDLRIEGRWEVERWCRKTGAKLPSLYSKNTIQTAALYKLLDIMFNTNSPSANDQLDNGSTIIEVGTSDYQVSCKSGYPQHPGSPDFGYVYYWFEDLTSNSYDASTIDVINDTTSLTFSIDSSTGWGTKPASENWIYKYTLQISKGGDSDFDDDGIDHVARLLSGNVDIGSNWHESGAGRIELYVENSGRTASQTIYSDSGYPSRSGLTTTVIFTQAAGTGTGQDWYYCSIRCNTADPGGYVTLSETQEEEGTKGASTENVYTYTLSVS